MMKKLIILFSAFILIASFVSCTLPMATPEGRWYCEELKIEIDFTLLNQCEQMCARQYNDDGTYQDIRCATLGATMDLSLPTDDEDITILTGSGKWKKRDNEFTITSRPDGTVYTFLPMSSDETTSNNVK